MKDTTEHEDTLQAAKIAWRDSSIARLEESVAKLEAELTSVRTRPGRQMRQNLTCFCLKVLSQIARLFSQKASNRFGRSAKKRSPGWFEPCTRKELFDRAAYVRFLFEESLSSETRMNFLRKVESGPLLSVVTVATETPLAHIEAMLASVQAQSYKNWELCIVDAASCHDRRMLLQQAEAQDSRIRVVCRDTSQQSLVQSNLALQHAEGSHVVFLGDGDEMDIDALLFTALALVDADQAKIVYADEDKITPGGERFDPHFKPDWNREYCFGTHYMGPFCAYERGLLNRISGFRDNYKGAEDYDLLLRCLHHVSDDEILHIPRVLYSRRASLHAEPTNPTLEATKWSAGARAVSDYLAKSTGAPIAVDYGPLPNTFVPSWPLTKEPSVQIIIPTRDGLDLIRNTVQSILAKTKYEAYGITIVDNGSKDRDTLAWLDKIAADKRVNILRDDSPFNFSALNNHAARQSSADVFAFLNNDVEILTPNWLREMVALAVRPGIGCVGAKLYFPNNTVQHAGVVLDEMKVADHIYKNHSKNSTGHFGQLVLRQEYSAVTAACLVIESSVFKEVGAFNEKDLAVAYNDIDLCLKCRTAGYRNIWTPLAELYHYESASRRSDKTRDKRRRLAKETDYMIKTWHHVLRRDQENNRLFRHFWSP